MTSPAERPAPLTQMPEAFTSLHEDARALLSSWQAPEPAELATRHRMIEVLDTDPGATWREHSRVHFTASLVVLDPQLEQVALTLHAKAKRWFQFGGHLEADDASVVDAARREGLEESGLAHLRLLPGLLQVDAHRLPPAFGWCTEHLDLRFAAVATSRDLSSSDESDDVRWWPLTALPEETEPPLRVAITRARENALREA